MAKKASRCICKTEKATVSDPSGCALKTTFNNVIVTITDGNGNVLSWSSAGKEGFKAQEKARILDERRNSFKSGSEDKLRRFKYSLKDRIC